MLYGDPCSPLAGGPCRSQVEFCLVLLGQEEGEAGCGGGGSQDSGKDGSKDSLLSHSIISSIMPLVCMGLHSPGLRRASALRRLQVNTLGSPAHKGPIRQQGGEGHTSSVSVLVVLHLALQAAVT